MKRLKKVLIVFFSVFFAFSPLNAFALKEKIWDMFDLNNIFYYDPDGEVCTPSSTSVSGSDVFMVGDSITVGAEAELKNKLSGIEIKAKVSKRFGGTSSENPSGLQIIEENKSELRKVVVMALGTNGTVSKEEISKALEIIGSSRTLVLTTNYKLHDESAYASNNEVIKKAAEENSNVKVADWAEAVKSDPEKYIVDGDQFVHPTSEGKTLFAETIASAVGGGGGAIGSGNTLYNGNQILSDETLAMVAENQKFYEKAANKYNIPWQILAVLHYRETGLKKYNPANGQGVYQLYSYTAGGSNSNAFKPAGDISDDEFQRQTDLVAELIRDSYGSGVDLNTDDGVKTFFFRYNGTAQAYISQARSLGFSEAEANRGEGSPYVMNLADEKRDSSKNSNWKQILTDGGLMKPANQQPGAFLIYAAIGGSSGYSSCSTGSSSGNGDLNQTAIDLAWPERGHGLTARDSYKTALADVGLSTYGEYYVRIGASCDAFVATVFRYSGVDPDFVCCGISGHGATWNYVTNSGKFEEVKNSAETLKPGDIRLSNGHIEMYVEVNGVGKIASASHGERTGDLGNFYDNSGTYKAYRWKGN